MVYQRIIIVFILCVISTNLHGQKLEQGLVGHWLFHGNAKDSSGLKNHGDVHGATLVPDRNGQINQAYYFDGDGDYIDVGNHPSLLSSSSSVNFWFKYSDPSVDRIFVGNYNSLNGEWGINCRLIADDRGVIVDVGAGGNNTQMGYKSRRTWSDDTWHMYSFTYNKLNNQLALYMDGCLLGYKNWNISNGGFNDYDSIQFYPGERWIFGAASQYFTSTPNNGPKWYKGALDDVRLYNRPLTAIEISLLYNSSDEYAPCDSSEAKSPFVVYPNPTSSHITIDYGDYAWLVGENIEIYNVIGQLIYSEKVVRKSTEIDLQSYASGCYILVVRDINLRVIQKKKIIVY